MTHPLRIAVLSGWHVHAEEYGRAALDHPDTELVAVWDDDEERGRGLASQLGVEHTPDLEALLAREDLDGVTVTSATTAHRDLLGQVIAAGKHIFTEKLLAPTVAECDELISAAEQAGIALTASLPRLAHGYTLAVRALLDSGRLGRHTYSRVRLAIGRAFADLAAHPVYLTQLILGTEVASVRASYTDMTGRGVEDNATVTVTTPDGAIGVIETGFVSPFSPFSIEIHGTEGSVLFSE